MTNRVFLGVSVGDDNGVSYNRKTPFNHTILNSEAYITSRAGVLVPGYVGPFKYDIDRRHYLFFNEAFPPNEDGARGRLVADITAGRLPIASFKMGVGSWVDGANASPTATGAAGTAYTNIRNRAIELRNLLILYPNTNIMVYIHHEPNSTVNEGGGGATTYAQSGAQWRALVENIWNIFVANGVPIWEGSWDGTTFVTTTAGMMYGALNLTWGPSMNGTADDFFPLSWTWGNQHVLFPAADSYNRRPAGTPPTGRWKAFGYGFTWHATDQFVNRTDGAMGIQPWAVARAAAVGHPFYPCILETNTEERSFYANGHFSWPAPTPETKANWFEHPTLGMGAFLSAWPASAPVFAVCTWDAIGTFDFRTDSTQAAEDAFIRMATKAPFIPVVVEPPPPPNDFVGAVSPHTRIRMGG